MSATDWHVLGDPEMSLEEIEALVAPPADIAATAATSISLIRLEQMARVAACLYKMPRALMGTNDPSNLVASCAPCNHKKRDKTDQEFIAQRATA